MARLDASTPATGLAVRGVRAIGYPRDDRGRCANAAPILLSPPGSPRRPARRRPARSSGPVEWTPDGLFYQARVARAPRGIEPQATRSRETFEGPLGARAAARVDPDRSGDPDWVALQRASSTSAGSRCRWPPRRSSRVAGDRAILDISLAGYVAAVLALFWPASHALPAGGGGRRVARDDLPPALTITRASRSPTAGASRSRSPPRVRPPGARPGPALAPAVGRAASCCCRFTRDSMWIPVLAAAGRGPPR